MRSLLIALPLALFAPTALAAQSPRLDPAATQCSSHSGKHTRTIELKSTKSGGCRVYLTRDGGEPKEVARADHQLHICSDVQREVIANLTDAGFTCE